MVNVADLRVPGIKPGYACRIRFCRPQLLPDLVRSIQQPYRVPQTLRHLGLSVQTGNPLGFGQDGLRLGKERLAPAELGVPFPGDLAGQLEMLDLIIPHRNQIGAV
jgi:hypothetical protein